MSNQCSRCARYFGSLEALRCHIRDKPNHCGAAASATAYQVVPHYGTHLDNFFADYPDYPYDSALPVMRQFYELCDQRGWEREDPVRAEARERLKDALVDQFNDIYGTDESNITAWVKLCQVLHIAPIPRTLEMCMQVVKETQVNIIDLVDTQTTGEPVQIFPDVFALSDYTKATGKFFPREHVRAGGVLQALLRHIIEPNKNEFTGRERRRQPRSRRGRGRGEGFT